MFTDKEIIEIKKSVVLDPTKNWSDTLGFAKLLIAAIEERHPDINRYRTLKQRAEQRLVSPPNEFFYDQRVYWHLPRLMHLDAVSNTMSFDEAVDNLKKI